MDNKKELSLDVPYREEISRLFIFRGLWIFVAVWPMYAWAIWIGIITFVHFWYQLILGRRHEVLFEKHVRFFRHINKWSAYLSFLVDKRPKFNED